jgi:hypothetical protein
MQTRGCCDGCGGGGGVQRECRWRVCSSNVRLQRRRSWLGGDGVQGGCGV